MAAGGDDESKAVLFAVQFINTANLSEQAVDTIEWEDAVVVCVEDKQWARRDEGSDLRKVPAVGVDMIHAVAVPLDHAIDDVIFKISNAGDWRGDLDAFVECGDPPTVRAAATAPGYAEAVLVYEVERLEIVECPDAVPRFDAGRSVAARVPPPHAMAIGAVVDAGKLAKLDCVDGKADIAVPGKPCPVMLIVGFVAVIDAINPYSAVAANVKDRRCRFVEVLRHIQVACDVQAGARLKVQLSNLKFVMFYRAGNGGL